MSGLAFWGARAGNKNTGSLHVLAHSCTLAPGVVVTTLLVLSLAFTVHLLKVQEMKA